ncbi:MAG: hypothetical protein JRF08_04940 [Deltaproteobacteria bacterium]|nr:hypothetical protein [Deltaproteobacteria bacterium]MBW2332801.1 hypothetical protein [Deltaproteobacteria bacterium]
MEIIDDPDAKELLAFLAQEEAGHLKRFTQLKAQLPKEATEGTLWDPDHEMNRYLQMMADMHVFRSDFDVEEKLSQVIKSEDVLKIGIQFEKDSIIFFLTMQDATEGEKGREFIGQLVNEEKKTLEQAFYGTQKAHSGQKIGAEELASSLRPLYMVTGQANLHNASRC